MKYLVAGNWKMNLTASDAEALASGLASGLVERSLPESVSVAVAPPYPYLQGVIGNLGDNAVTVAAQDMSDQEFGAFTGQVSAPMIKSVGAQSVIIGHSERRQFNGETDASVNRKTSAALAAGLLPIVCVGEHLEEREAGRQQEVVLGQIRAGLEGISISSPDDLVVAYEPIWAIGTGVTASPDQAQEMHAMIRSCLAELFGAETASEMRILYGGSVKPGNAAELFGRQDVNGGLVGGASLKAEDFLGIIDAAIQVAG